MSEWPKAATRAADRAASSAKFRAARAVVAPLLQEEGGEKESPEKRYSRVIAVLRSIEVRHG